MYRLLPSAGSWMALAARAGILDSNTPRRNCVALAALLGQKGSIASFGLFSRASLSAYAQLLRDAVQQPKAQSTCSDTGSRLKWHPEKHIYSMAGGFRATSTCDVSLVAMIATSPSSCTPLCTKRLGSFPSRRAQFLGCMCFWDWDVMA